MPQIKDAPKEVNDILESAYQAALKDYPDDKEKASKISYGALKNAGWEQDKDGKWVKKKKEMADDLSQWITINGEHILLGSDEAHQAGIIGKGESFKTESGKLYSIVDVGEVEEEGKYKGERIVTVKGLSSYKEERSRSQMTLNKLRNGRGSN